MELDQIITIIIILLMIVLIFTNYIVVKKPQKYLIIPFMIYVILVNAQLTININKNLEITLVTIYIIILCTTMICCEKREKK